APACPILAWFSPPAPFPRRQSGRLTLLACPSRPGRIASSQRTMQESHGSAGGGVAAMSKYAVFFTLKGEAIARAMEQPSDRVMVVSKAVESAGGKLEAYYLMFGQYDGFVIVDLPDSRGGGRDQPGGEQHRGLRAPGDPRAHRGRGPQPDPGAGQGHHLPTPRHLVPSLPVRVCRRASVSVAVRARSGHRRPAALLPRGGRRRQPCPTPSTSSRRPRPSSTPTLLLPTCLSSARTRVPGPSMNSSPARSRSRSSISRTPPCPAVRPARCRCGSCARSAPAGPWRCSSTSTAP